MINVNAETREPIDILPNCRKETIKGYLYQYGADVEMVAMNMNPIFKAAVRQALEKEINNQTRMMKRSVYGFRSFKHFKAKILLNIRYKETGVHLG